MTPFLRGFLIWLRVGGRRPEQLTNSRPYERALRALRPERGWKSQNEAKRALGGLPDTLDGRRPQTLDDVVECVSRDVTGTPFRARLTTIACRIRLMGAGVDPCAVQGKRVLGSVVPKLRRHIREGAEIGRLSSGRPGRN
jgi:hypothetical protein